MLIFDREFVVNTGARYRGLFLAGTALAVAALFPSVVLAQSTWVGAGSTTNTGDYNTGTNWSTNPVAPVAAGSSAVFDTTGSTAVSVTAPVTTNSWTFNANSQSYTITGSAVSLGNLTNNASAGQAISIANDMTGSSLIQPGASTLTLSGTNQFTSTFVILGTLANTGSLTSNVITSLPATFVNSLTVIGGVGNSGNFINNAAGTVSSLLFNNAGTTTNAGQLNGGVSILGGTVTNSNIVTTGVTVDGTGTYTQSAGTTSGSLTNASIVNANGGAINGPVANNANGTFNVGGAVTGSGTFNNSASSSVLHVANGGTYSVTGLVKNSGTAAGGGIRIDAGGDLDASAGGITNQAAATIVNNGIAKGNVFNAGVINNNLTWTGAVSNSGTFNNNALGTVSGLLTNAAGTTTNTGALNGGASVSGGTVSNSNIVNGGVNVSGAGTYTQSAGTTSGGLTNSNIVNADGGAINGAIANNTAGVFTAGGTVTANNTFTNNGTAQLAVTGGNFTGLTTLTNNSTNANGIVVATGKTLSATSISNKAGAFIQNSGTLTATAGSITNTGTINNLLPGSVINAGLINNNNAATINAQGTINAPILNNNTSVFTVTGALTSNNLFFNTDTAQLAVTGGNFTGLTSVGNNSTNANGIVVATGKTLSAASISNNAGAFIQNSGTLTGTNGFGAITNQGTINNLLPGSVINGGLINANAATVNAQGTINGFISNANTSVFTVTGNLAGNSDFAINDTAKLIVSGGNFTGLTSLNNGSTNANGIVVATGKTLSANTISSSGFIQNSGTLTAVFVDNSGTLNNLLATSIINGGLLNLAGGTTTNAGTINGGVTIVGGTVFNTGTINGGVTVFGGTVFNSGSAGGAGGVVVTSTGTYTQTAGTTSGGLSNDNIVNANGGAINFVDNNAGGIFNVGGAVTNNSLFFNAAATSRLLVNSGSYTIAGVVTNSGTNAAGGIAVAAGATLNANGGITNNAGATIVNNGTVNDVLNNAGIVTNNLNYNADVATNTGTITNSATGSWTGNVIGNAGNATGITNNGVWAGNVQANTGTITNNAAWTGNVVSSAGTITNNLTWTGTVANSGTFNNSAGATVSGLLTNSGTTNNAGTLSGGLTNTAGTTNNTGTIAGSTTIGGGVLTGTGSVSNLTVTGGTFAPGNGTPGTATTLTGSLALQSGAFYLVQINPTTSSLANVTGMATLSGATVKANFTSGSYLARQYLILHTTAGVTGTFDPAVANTNLPFNFGTSLSYSATDVFLNLTAALGAQQSLSANQRNVANAINNFFNNGGGAISPGFAALFGLTGSNLSSALSQGSGETATGSQQTTFDAMNLFMGVMTDPFIAGRGVPAAPPSGAAPYAEEEALAYASRKRTSAERDAYAMFTKAPLAQNYDPHWSVWAASFGGSQTTDGNGAQGSNNTTSRVFGMAAGADYIFSPRTIAGFALAGGGTNFSVANGGSGRSDLFQAGAFVRHTVGPAYFTGALAYGWQDITTDRTVTIAGVDRLRAQFNANAWSGRVEGGYRFVTRWMGVTPYAAAQFTTFELPAYAENVVSGANTFALGYGAKSVTASRSEIGLRTDKSWAMPDSIFTLRGRFAWAHDYNPDRSIGATFQTLPGASFVVNGAAQSADKALTTASAEVKWRSGVSLAGTFESEFSGNSASYAGKGVARYQW